ncbi:MAG: hypothetical protein GY716_16455 [bacterium]|nr:hypothetical protein [bacterium]
MSERGATLLELLITLVVAAVVMTVVAVSSLSVFGREGARSAIYDVQTFMQTARTESITRNQDCRFVVDSSKRKIYIYDTQGTSLPGDDVLLKDQLLPSVIGFARPDTGSPITLSLVSGTTYETVFSGDGSVSAGTGEVVLFGGEHYAKISVYGAGGLLVEHWDGSGWQLGS